MPPAAARPATVSTIDPVAAVPPPSPQTVRVLEQAYSADPSSIPASVVDYFEGRGYRLVPACALPWEIDRRARFRSHPLRVDDLPEPDRPRLLRELQEGGFTVRDGIFRRSDTAVFAQPLDEYRARGEAALAHWQSTLPNDDLAARSLSDVAGDEIIATGLLRIYTREEMNRRTQ